MTEYEDKNGLVTDDKIKKYLTDNDYKLTADPGEALYVLRDGSFVSGEYEYGYRTQDHKMMQDLISEGDGLYTDSAEKFWGALHAKTEMIRVVPETNEALIGVNQKLTSKQQAVVDSLGYQVDEYVKMPQLKRKEQPKTKEKQHGKSINHRRPIVYPTKGLQGPVIGKKVQKI